MRKFPAFPIQFYNPLLFYSYGVQVLWSPVSFVSVRDLEVLPKAPPPPPRTLTDKELKTLRDKEESTLRELRIFLREVVNKVVKDRKFYIFARPVDVEEVTICLAIHMYVVFNIL